MRVYFHSFAKYIPKRCVTNDELSTLMDTSNEWIVQRTGIETRYWVTEPETTSDLGANAAKLSIERAGVDVDCIIAATLSPDYSFPGIGVQIQEKLGLKNVPAFDLRNQCAGFLYGAQMAVALVKSGDYKNILLVGAEVHSTGLDISTRGRDIAVLFGDGAGSCIVSSEARGYEFLGSKLYSEGAHLKELWCEHPGSAHFPTRITADLVDKCYPSMNGKVVFQFAVKRMTECSLELLAMLGIKEIGLFIPHQANLRINQMVAKELGLNEFQVFNTIQKYGNTTSATIPIGFTDAEIAGAVKKDSIILSSAFGSGFVWGSAAWRSL
jgi:3-oxoacyl-[acyl-carrier-protein] synthase-3